MEKALHDAEIEYLTIHELRHTTAQLAVQSGANVKAVHPMLGHKPAAVTLDLYADLWVSDLQAVAGALETARDSAVNAHRLNTDDNDGVESAGKAGTLIPLRGSVLYLQDGDCLQDRCATVAPLQQAGPLARRTAL